MRYFPDFVALALLCGRLDLAAAETPVPATSAMAPVIREFVADESSLAHAYDLPWSEAAMNRSQLNLDGWRARLAAMDFEALDPAGRIDWLLLRNHIDAELSGLGFDRVRLREMDEVLPFRKPVQDLEVARWRTGPVDAERAAGTLAEMVTSLKVVRQRLEKGRPPAAGRKDAESKDAKELTGKKDDVTPLVLTPVVAQRAAKATEEIRRTLEKWFVFHDGFQPDFSWWVRQPHEKLAKALDDHAKFLREEVAGQKGTDDDPLVGDPIGAEALAREIGAEMLGATAADLVAVGEKEFAWCEARMKESSREMGLGDDTMAALAKVKAAHVPPGGQDDLVAAEARRAVDFVKSHDLVTIPPLCEETWRLEMISPQGQKTLPYAVYGSPAMRIAYAKDEMPHEDKIMSMRGNNRHFLRIVTPHELIPGHHLQRFVATRSLPHRSLFSTPFYVEGWALYWETRLWDLGYADSPEDRIGMLFWRMHRCARIITTIKFHLGEMTPTQMVDFLVARVGHERMAATSEVRRYIGGDYGPLYQAGYLLGGLQFRALHSELVGTRKMTDREFNDSVLAQNAIPIELLRAALIGAPLTRDWKPVWRLGEAR